MKMRRGDVTTESHRATSEAYVPRCTKNDCSNAGSKAAGTAKIDAAVRIYFPATSVYLVRRGDELASNK